MTALHIFDLKYSPLIFVVFRARALPNLAKKKAIQ